MFTPFVYNSGLAALANGEFNFATANLKITLVQYYYGEINSNTEIGIPDYFKDDDRVRNDIVLKYAESVVNPLRINCTVVNSVSNHYVDVVFSDVTFRYITDYNLNGAVIYLDTGDANTDTLIAFCDFNTSFYQGISPDNQSLSIKFQQGMRFQYS